MVLVGNMPAIAVVATGALEDAMAMFVSVATVVLTFGKRSLGLAAW
jgi:hypothetical protein